MIAEKNPYQLNTIGNIEVRTIDQSSGQAVPSWSAEYSNVYMKRLAPPRGTETNGAMQDMAVQRDSFLIRKEGKTVTAKNHRIVIDSEYFYVSGVRPYKSSINFIVLDTTSNDLG